MNDIKTFLEIQILHLHLKFSTSLQEKLMETLDAFTYVKKLCLCVGETSIAKFSYYRPCHDRQVIARTHTDTNANQEKRVFDR